MYDVSKFADDSKLCKNVNNANECLSLQKDLDKLYSWSQTWQMQFNVDKCSIIYLGHDNRQCKYMLGNSVLKSSDAERDLGIIIDNKLKLVEQCNIAIKNANSTLGIIKRHIKSRNRDIILRLYN